MFAGRNPALGCCVCQPDSRTCCTALSTVKPDACFCHTYVSGGAWGGGPGISAWLASEIEVFLLMLMSTFCTAFDDTANVFIFGQAVFPLILAALFLFCGLNWNSSLADFDAELTDGWVREKIDAYWIESSAAGWSHSEIDTATVASSRVETAEGIAVPEHSTKQLTLKSNRPRVEIPTSRPGHTQAGDASEAQASRRSRLSQPGAQLPAGPHPQDGPSLRGHGLSAHSAAPKHP